MTAHIPPATRDPSTFIPRREVLWRAGIGGLALALAGAEARTAQDATPAADEQAPYLFVQGFSAGTFAPAEGEDGDAMLTLTQDIGWTLYFTDRPERVAGIMQTTEFLAALSQAATDPPNAALVSGAVTSAGTTGEEEHIWVMTLLDGAYDAVAGELSYRVRIINPIGTAATRFIVEPKSPPDTAQSLRAGTLFIDNIDIFVTPYVNGKPIHGS